MNNDMDLQKAVLKRLELEPKIDLADLGVSVRDGVVTLQGTVDSEAEKSSTEHIVKVMNGVRGLVDDDLNVLSKRCSRRTDEQLAAAASEAIEWLTTIPKEAVRVTVRDGWLTVEGQVELRHQAHTIEEVLRDIAGVKGIINLLTIQPANSLGSQRATV